MDTKKLIEKSRKIFQRAIDPLEHKSSPDENTADLSQKQEENLEKGVSEKKVTIYALSTCPWCKKAKKFFTEKEIPVDYIEYDKVDEETRNLIKEDCKSYMEELGFPVVKVGEDVVIGYNTKKYASLLNQ